MYFNPPIEERSDKELIHMAYVHPEDWQEEAVIIAKRVLEQRNVSPEFIQEEVSKSLAIEQHQKNVYHRQRQKNAKQSYTKFQLLVLYVLSIFIVSNFFTLGATVSELKEENYLIKYRQRRLALILGTAIWVTLILLSAQRQFTYEDKAFQQQMDSIDISEWEKNHPH